MILELEDVRLRVHRTESELDESRKRMDEWQKMFDLNPGFREGKEPVAKSGKEYVVTPDPFNVVNKAIQLLPDAPKIDVPQRDENDTDRRSAETKEKFLTAMYARLNEQSGKNFLKEMAWYALVRGVAYAEVLWIRDQVPEKARKRTFPFSIRALDPKEVGLHRGPTGVEYAYHIWRLQRIDAKAKYPDLKLWKKGKSKKDKYEKESEEVEIIDYWHRDEKTWDIYHCLIIDEEFQIEPVKTDYPFIPLIEANGERGLSILHAINGLWQYKSRLSSTIATAVLGYVFPMIIYQTETGQVIEDFEVRPLMQRQVPFGTKVEVIKPDVNLPLLNDMLAKVDAAIQQSTFPAVLYGDAGTMQAGYGVNILSQHASGRITPFRESLERCLQAIHEAVFSLLEAMDDENEGVELYGKDQVTQKSYKLCLYKDDIDGHYENIVTLRPNVPQDDMQKITLGLQLVAAKVISKEHMRDNYLSIASPSDEQDRIDMETAMENPAMTQKNAVIAAMKRHPETWEAVLAGTPLYDIAMKMAFDVLGLPPPQNVQPQPQPMMPPMGGPPPMPPPGLQPPGLAGPQGGGFPPVMTGQLEPENIGLPPQGNPALFAAAMGQPLSPMDSARALEGAPPMI